VLAAAVQAQGGPKHADERTVDDAIELLTTLRKTRAISSAQYTRALQPLTLPMRSTHSMTALISQRSVMASSARCSF
jgi:hypothetical protein